MKPSSLYELKNLSFWTNLEISRIIRSLLTETQRRATHLQPSPPIDSKSTHASLTPSSAVRAAMLMQYCLREPCEMIIQRRSRDETEWVTWLMCCVSFVGQRFLSSLNIMCLFGNSIMLLCIYMKYFKLPKTWVVGFILTSSFPLLEHKCPQNLTSPKFFLAAYIISAHDVFNRKTTSWSLLLCVCVWAFSSCAVHIVHTAVSW